MPAMWLRYQYCTEVNGSPGPAVGEFLTWPMNSNARSSSCQKFPEERSCAKPPRLTIQQSVNTGRAHKYCFARIQSLRSEERRVGKDGKSLCRTQHQKKT